VERLCFVSWPAASDSVTQPGPQTFGFDPGLIVLARRPFWASCAAPKTSAWPPPGPTGAQRTEGSEGASRRRARPRSRRVLRAPGTGWRDVCRRRTVAGRRTVVVAPCDCARARTGVVKSQLLTLSGCPLSGWPLTLSGCPPDRSDYRTPFAFRLTIKSSNIPSSVA
jgi:hypothetical protein